MNREKGAIELNVRRLKTLVLYAFSKKFSFFSFSVKQNSKSAPCIGMNNLSNGLTDFDPLNNFFFYKIFGERGDEVQLLGFINAVLGKTGNDQFTSVKIHESKSFMAEILGNKSCVLDVRARLPNGSYVNVEVQIKDKHNFDRRSLFYLSKEYTRSLKSGEDYVILPNVIAINIVDFDFPKTKNFHSCFHLHEDSEHEIIMTDALEVHFINMVKYRKQRKDRQALKDPLYRWLLWFDKNSPHEMREEAISMDSAIKTAEERFKNIIQDEDELDAYYRYLMAECDRTSELNFAIEENDKKWQILLADKEAENARLRAELELKSK